MGAVQMALGGSGGEFILRTLSSILFFSFILGYDCILCPGMALNNDKDWLILFWFWSQSLISVFIAMQFETLIYEKELNVVTIHKPRLHHMDD